MYRLTTALTLTLALALSACLSIDDDSQGTTPDLTIGATGDEVVALHAYLARYGYLPGASKDANADGSSLVSEGPARLDTFDAQTAAAVRALQRMSGLEPTGIVDAATQASIDRPRCDVPDGRGRRGHGAEGESTANGVDKFALWSSKWPKKNLTWRVTAALGSCSLDDSKAAARAAMAEWQSTTGLTLTEKASGTADIMIRVGHDDDTNRLAWAVPPASGGDVTANDVSDLRCDGSGGYDLATVLLHEVGHGLGLDHSSNVDATMYPWVDEPDVNLLTDDELAISVLYDEWTVSTTATDLAMYTSNWIITAEPAGTFGNFTIAQLVFGAWVTTDGFAKRIAVGPDSRPWVVNAEGQIWRRTTTSATTGNWELMPGCATDIAAGQGGAVWILGCDDILHGKRIYKFNGVDWTADASVGGAVRISVGVGGRPWIINSIDRVFYKKRPNASSVTWVNVTANLPRFSGGVDIASDIMGNGCVAGNVDDGSGTIGSGSIFVFEANDQLFYDTGEEAAPERFEWIQYPAGQGGRSCGLQVIGGNVWKISSNNLLVPTK